MFRQYYDFPIFNTPKGLDKALNTFYQAKYGMFTCYDLNHCHGKVRYETDLINYWNRKAADREYTWYLAIAYSIMNSKVKFEDLEDYRLNYRESKPYRAYIRNHPNHTQLLDDMTVRIKGEGFYEKYDQDQFET